MVRSITTFEIELRLRNLDGGIAVGTAMRYLYTDKEGQDWVRIQDEWYELEDEGDLHVYVHELPPDVSAYGYERYDEEEAA